MSYLLKPLFAIFLLAAAMNLHAMSPKEVHDKLVALKLPAGAVQESELPGFYESKLINGATLYISKDGEHFLVGDLYRVEETSFVNVTEEKLNGVRKEKLADLDEQQMVVFSPPEQLKRGRITVFTDIDCTYCRKLHQEVPDLNRLGIEVRYMAYPRAGVGSRSYDKLVSTWCADNQQLAMTRAKLGEEIEPLDCDNPIASQYEIGGEFGVTGTPAIVFDDGQIQMGYSPAANLAQRMGLSTSN